MANFFLAAIIYFSYMIGKRDRMRDYVAVGLVAGLAIAARWPIGLALLIPFLSSTNVLIERRKRTFYHVGRLAFVLVFRIKFLLVIPTTILGAFIGNPTLFLEFRSIFAMITNVVFSYQNGRGAQPVKFAGFQQCL